MLEHKSKDGDTMKGEQKYRLFDQNDELVEALRDSRLFSHWPESMIRKLVPLTEFFDFPAGVEILKEGQQNDRVFFLTRGGVEVLAGGQHILDLKRKGDIFGEMSVISQKPCTAS
ncbi:MAG: cyclic nucleotide-binding domain-containing protein, partial [SAR324 cluster bacterium]|nr:cyclic nucleotide-binding domain-containing protein [SAR324 cluster bacterium]